MRKALFVLFSSCSSLDRFLLQESLACSFLLELGKLVSLAFLEKLVFLELLASLPEQEKRVLGSSSNLLLLPSFLRKDFLTNQTSLFS